jgi:hypothetical protein
LADTVEGLTDLPEILASIIRCALADEALASGLKARLADMQGRLERLQRRAEKRRQLARDVMLELELKKARRPGLYCLNPARGSHPLGDRRGFGAQKLLGAARAAPEPAGLAE